MEKLTGYKAKVDMPGYPKDTFLEGIFGSTFSDCNGYIGWRCDKFPDLWEPVYDDTPPGITKFINLVTDHPFGKPDYQEYNEWYLNVMRDRTRYRVHSVNIGLTEWTVGDEFMVSGGSDHKRVIKEFLWVRKVKTWWIKTVDGDTILSTDCIYGTATTKMQSYPNRITKTLEERINHIEKHLLQNNYRIAFKL